LLLAGRRYANKERHYCEKHHFRSHGRFPSDCRYMGACCLNADSMRV